MQKDISEKKKLQNELEKLIEIRKIFLKDKEENFEHQRLLTSLDCWIEDLDIQLEGYE